MINWIKKMFIYLMFALSNVEKNALSQKGEDLNDNNSITQKMRVNQLADDLIQGRITEEVILLRARLYKVIEASSELENAVKPILNDNGEITGYDISVPANKKPLHKKIKGDSFDNYKVLMVINNEPITASVLDSFERIDKYGIEQENSIIVNRDIHAKFNIEKYAKKLFIREIDSETRLLEFYIPKYYDEYNRTSNLLISAIKKAMVNPRQIDLLDIKSIGFITNKDIGVKDFLEFQYLIDKFDKIVEYDGNYVIKFIGKVMVENENILEKYRNEKLDEKYNNKEFKGKL